MASGDEMSMQLSEAVSENIHRMSDDEDEDDETWDEMEAESENFMSCLFCSHNFKTMAVALEHCRTDHNFNLTTLKNKFRMDCYSYICMINYLRRERVCPETLLSFKDPPWLNKEYLVPVIPDDPWLMFDFEGLESPMESRCETPEEDYHVVNSENGLVTLTEQHFVQLQHKIKHLALQVQEKEEALAVAADQIQKMKAVTQKLVGTESDEKDIEKTMVKMKICGDEGYFKSYSHFGIHHEMLSDKIRTLAYRNALLNNPEVISDKVVLDVGCGTGILSMFAATANAAKVYGVDQSEIIYHAMDIVRENKLENKIDLIHGKAETVSLPVSKVDVIVSEWMGYFLLFEGMFDSVIVARNRFLKPGGRLLPSRCVLYVQGISDPETYDKLLGFWSDVYGFKMSSLFREVIQEAQVFLVPYQSVATSAAPVLNLDLYTADVNSTNFSSDFCLESKIDGNLTALCGYFDAHFDLPNPVSLSTSPEKEKTHWKQTVFFFPQPIPITKGVNITGNLTCQRVEEDNRGLVIKIDIMGQKHEYYLT